MTGQGATVEPASSYRRLGGVRFLLSLLVLLWHTQPISEVPLAWLRGTGVGTMAVLMFYVISGFIVTEAILASYRDRPFAFLGNRVVRLWPGFVAAVLLTALIGAVSGHLPEQALVWRNVLANALALFPTVPVTDSLLGLDGRYSLMVITWALRAVFTFYVLAAIVLLLARWCSARALPLVLAAVLLASLIGYHLFYLTPRISFYLGLAPHFVLGSTTALWLNGRLSPRWSICLVAAAFLLALGHAFNFTTNDPDRVPWRLAPAWADLVDVGLWMLMLAWAWLRLKRPVSRPARARDQLLGKLSYNVFLFHLPAIALVAWAWPQKDWSSLLPAIALTLLFAALFGWLVDPLIDRWRDRLRRRSPAEM